MPPPHQIFRFFNGTYIFRNGKIILPASTEGQEITEILHRQREGRELNDKQTKLWKEVTSASNAEEALKLLIPTKVPRPPTPPSSFKFSNGDFIFLKRGIKDPKTGEIIKQSRIIDPKSEEGKKIEEILDLQRKNEKLNEEQTQRRQMITQISTMEGAIDFLLNDENQK